MAGRAPTRVRVVAQDPGVPAPGRTAAVELQLPWELLDVGPVGHRAHVIDYDATTRTMYAPSALIDGAPPPFVEADLDDPSFHARNVYALVTHTLGRFEVCLGRRVDWQFRAHQLKLVPHAFEMANAFYARDLESIVFGYFDHHDGSRAFTCLSHDVVVHETAHALLDGLRSRFMAPSSPDQAAFHEAFADIIALLATYTLPDVVGRLLPGAGPTIATSDVDAEHLKESALFAVGDRFLESPDGKGLVPLRQSVLRKPSTSYLGEAAYQEEHARAEILVAAVMNAFVEVWCNRMKGVGAAALAELPRARVAEEGAEIAEQLLTMVIRAIDYTPPIHLDYSDFLTAMLTADVEVRPDDDRYHLRDTLLLWFGRYGIQPVEGAVDGCWAPPGDDDDLVVDGTNFVELQSDPAEMFRLIWNNRDRLRLDPEAYTHVSSVRPSLRVGPEDGQLVCETVAECLQYVKVRAGDLERVTGIRKPRGVPPDAEIRLEGGSTLILDQYGRLKFEISNRLPDPRNRRSRAERDRRRRIQSRLERLAELGYLNAPNAATARLAELHRRRFSGAIEVPSTREVW